MTDFPLQCFASAIHATSFENSVLFHIVKYWSNCNNTDTVTPEPATTTPPPAEPREIVEDVKETQSRSGSRASKKERKTRSRQRSRRGSKDFKTTNE